MSCYDYSDFQDCVVVDWGNAFLNFYSFYTWLTLFLFSLLPLQIDTILACGGLAKNPLFIQEHADILGFYLSLFIVNLLLFCLFHSSLLVLCFIGRLGPSSNSVQ